MLLYIYLMLFYMRVVGDWRLYCPHRHRSCRIAELDTLNKSLFNADFWTNISTGHNILCAVVIYGVL